jgi:hypothetical protein
MRIRGDPFDQDETSLYLMTWMTYHETEVECIVEGAPS